MDWQTFSFEYRLDGPGLTSLLIEIEASRKAVEKLLLPPDWRDQLDRLNRIRTIRGTTALEGNPLSEAQVRELLDRETEASATTRESRQIENADAAQNWVRERFGPGEAPLAVADILRMHELLTRGSDEGNNVPGRLRAYGVQVGTPDLGGVHLGAPHEELPQLLDDFVVFVNSRRVRNEHPVVRALLAHFFLVTIHPFGDGNGRVSRLVEAAILFEGGYNVHGFYGLSNYFYRNGDLYKRRQQECRRVQPVDVTRFVEFGLRGFDAELRGINSFINSKLNRLVYRQTLTWARDKRVSKRRRLINEREHGLLGFLLEETEPADPFSESPSRRLSLDALIDSPFVDTVYRAVTSRTFFRELTRLAELGFIIFERDADSGEFVVDLDFEAIGKYGSK
ncbi:Fic family protein [Candidatus Palauibacter polyketidifaciens]|uniref:Fic family protein n=1 Tax=Candidatus Palauibacter polyketidifaciens TaxID=3056740 RepID=UPI0023A2AF7D|nr:Fic family protein [Candidatus Palauibacter polyketidifaciens]MDE2719215.1 Fic family protein [Candidatus Palauibacter polyketidifaciens]